MEKPWLIDVSDIEKQLGTNISSGLSDENADERLLLYGRNQLKKKKKKHPIFLFFEQFKSFIIWVLIIAAIISGLLKEWIDTFAIIGIVILNSILGFIQEYKAEKALDELKKLFSHYTKVLRNGTIKTILSELLVPGDIIELDAGDNIPADCRVAWHTSNFTVQEASLTGESAPVPKTNIPLNEPDAIIADRANMVYMGTSVVSGRARCIVVGTGMQTELGKITEMIQEADYEETPLQKRLEDFGRVLVYICLLLVGLVFLVEYLRGGKFIDV
ncbi:MAG TPA: cation-transporting P-type ATPase, partial [bacterium]|nr:cation-transporting P-type ATPase [bacterium]